MRNCNNLVNRAISLVQTDSYSKLCTNPLISNMIVTQTELLNISQKESPQGHAAEEQNSLLVFTTFISALQENVSLFAYKQENKICVHQYGCKILKSKKYTCIH